VTALLVGLLLLAPAAPPKPAIVAKPIPFGAQRRAETAAYARRHYGLDTWRLVSPHVIVEHYTASESFSSAYATFASDAPDSELHELPGTCAHFVIDRDGTIYQLVPLTTICRHTVGLNYTAIGIEHVGRSDAEILGNPRQLAASLRHPAAQRDRAQREPDQPLPPRALRGLALPDPRRLDPSRHGRLPRPAPRARAPLPRGRRAARAPGRAELLRALTLSLHTD
jgi:beta-N-acetylhexosaminidase